MRMQVKVVSPEVVAGKRVLVRVDFNVPLEENEAGIRRVVDDSRIRASVPTIEFLLKNGAKKVILISHLGRPKGPDPSLSMAPVAAHLDSLLDASVACIADDQVVSPSTAARCTTSTAPVLVLENTRFRPEEKQNEPSFAAELASLADVFVNDAFSSSHRAHASTVGVAKHLPAYVGIGLQAELEHLTPLLHEPKRPFIVVLGGAKISDKVGALQHLSRVADAVLVGGGVANDFLKAEGIEIHKSYLQDTPADLKKEGVDYVQVARELIDQHRHEKVLKDGYIPLPKILYPLDVIAAPDLETSDPSQLQTLDLTHDMLDTPNDQNLLYLDIGPKTQRLFTEILHTAGTVFWNGPMGVWENQLFRPGTQAVATAASECSSSIIGGGDTIAAVATLGLRESFTHTSLAGGATLEFLSGEPLPGIAVLQTA